jgi:hypothetical protein
MIFQEFRAQRNFPPHRQFLHRRARNDAALASSLEEAPMHGIIYIVGLIVVIMFILSFLGLR